MQLRPLLLRNTGRLNNKEVHPHGEHLNAVDVHNVVRPVTMSAIVLKQRSVVNVARLVMQFAIVLMLIAFVWMRMKMIPSTFKV